MTNSYNPPKAPDYSSGLAASNARQLQQLDRFQAAQRQNDQREIQNARQQEQLLRNLVGFSTTLKGYLDKKEEKEEKEKYVSARVAFNQVNPTNDEYLAIQEYNQAAKKDGIVFDKLASKIQDEDRRKALLGLNQDHWLYFADFTASSFGLGLPALIQENSETIGLNNPQISITDKTAKVREFIADASLEAGIDDYRYGKYILPELDKHLTTVLNKSVKDTQELRELQLAEIHNKLFSNALKQGNLADVYDEYVQKQAASKGRTLANSDGYEMLLKLVDQGMTTTQLNEFLGTQKPHDGAKGGIAELRKRFSDNQISELENKIQKKTEKDLDALKLKKKNDFRQINNAAIENTNQRFLEGEDPRALIRDLERVQGANKRDFGMTDDRLDKKIEALNKSDGSFDAQNAYFDELYGKGQLTAEMVEETEDPRLMDQWLGRAQTQDKAREGDDYRDSKNSVVSLVKGVDTTFAKTGGSSGLNPSANAVASLLRNKFEAKVTQLVELEDPNAAVNAALYVQKYWTENGGGTLAAANPTGLFAIDADNSFPNYEEQLGGDASITAQKILEFEKLNIKTKIDMSGGNAQRSLDTPNVFLNESEIKEAIEQINDGDGYSVKLKLVSGLYPTLGGPQEILDKQAAALDIEVPERPASIETIYKQGNPFINCLINERGVEGLSTNQLLRQCRALDETYPLPTRN